MKRNYSKLSKRIMWRYILYWLLLLAALLSFYFLSGFIARLFTWHYGDPLYTFLKLLENFAPWLIITALLIGTLILTYAAIRKSLDYIDITLDAAKSLSSPANEMILLPNELIDVQNELNLVRESSLRNISAAEDAVKRKNDLVMYLAHDLKTPLASVIAYLNLLQDTENLSEETQKKYLGIALDKAQRLEDLINEFFDITRFNLSQITLNYQTIDLTRMLEQTVFEFMPLLQDKNLTCDLQIKDPIPLRCDPDKLQRVFDNILRNALAYSFPDSAITISIPAVPVQNRTVSIIFSNQGNTIAKENLARIFEQFYRLDSSRGSRGGAGLGLAIARQIILLHKGTITAESENNKTTFTVTLPMTGGF